MRNIYVNENSDPIRVFPLSRSGGTTLNALWKQRKDMWYLVESAIEMNIVDRLTPRQFHEAIENGMYLLSIDRRLSPTPRFLIPITYDVQ